MTTKKYKQAYAAKCHDIWRRYNELGALKLTVVKLRVVMKALRAFFSQPGTSYTFMEGTSMYASVLISVCMPCM